MKKSKKEEISAALAGIPYGDWCTIQQVVERSYHITKKELTSEEISSQINAFSLPSDSSRS